MMSPTFRAAAREYPKEAGKPYFARLTKAAAEEYGYREVHCRSASPLRIIASEPIAYFPVNTKNIKSMNNDVELHNAAQPILASPFSGSTLRRFLRVVGFMAAIISVSLFLKPSHRARTASRPSL
jgi:hypothetical protein